MRLNFTKFDAHTVDFDHVVLPPRVVDIAGIWVKARQVSRTVVFYRGHPCCIVDKCVSCFLWLIKVLLSKMRAFD